MFVFKFFEMVYDDPGGVRTLDYFIDVTMNCRNQRA